MTRLKIVDIDTAVEVYYTAPEFGNAEIMKMFACGKSAALRLKKIAQAAQAAKGQATFSNNTVNPKTAFEAWNIDIKELEKRFFRKQKLIERNVLS